MNQIKTCTKCNIEKLLSEFNKQTRGKYGVRADCKQCRDKYYKQWQENNPEYTKHNYQAKKEYYAEQTKLYYQEHKKERKEYYKQWHQNNKHKVNERSKQYNIDNKEILCESRKQYAQTPKGKAVAKAAYQNRRAHKLNNGGKHTAKDILELFDLQSGKCPYCKAKLAKTGNNKYHVDHVMPLNKGGTNNISNIQLLCPSCNLSKQDKLPEEFAAKFNKLF